MPGQNPLWDFELLSDACVELQELEASMDRPLLQLIRNEDECSAVGYILERTFQEAGSKIAWKRLDAAERAYVEVKARELAARCRMYV